MDFKKEYRVSDLFRRSGSERVTAGDSASAPTRDREAPGVAEQSPWKKEVKLGSLFRRPKKAKQPALPSYGESAASEAQPGRMQAGEPVPSVWKKEIKLSTLFKRGRKPTRLPREPLALPSPGATVAEAPTAPSPVVPDVEPVGVEKPLHDGQAPSVGERSAETVGDDEVEAGPAGAMTAEEPPAAVAERAAPAPRQSLWKKELAFGGKKPKAEKARGEKPGGPERRAAKERPKDDKPARTPVRSAKGSDKLPQVPLMKALNLLPKDVQLAKQTTVRPGVLQAAAVGVSLLVLGGTGFFYLSARNDWKDQSAALEDKRNELVALQAQQKPTSSDDTELAGEALGRATALSAAISARFNWDRLLREVSLTLPADVWFDTFESAGPDASSTTSRPAGLTITGFGKSQTDVAYFLSRLQRIPEFASVQLQTATREKIGETYVIKFSVIGALK